MKIYLARHGDSVPKEFDSERPLSQEGKNEVQVMGNMLAKADTKIDNIFHSGVKRAEQTAEILASCLSFKKAIAIHAGLEPLDSVKAFAAKLEQEKDNALFVGHLPFMAKLLGLLITGDENNVIADFPSASILCLERERDEQWVIAWMLIPDLFH